MLCSVRHFQLYQMLSSYHLKKISGYLPYVYSNIYIKFCLKPQFILLINLHNEICENSVGHLLFCTQKFCILHTVCIQNVTSSPYFPIYA